MTREEARSWIIDHWGNDLEDGTKQSEVVKICLSALSENKGEGRPKGHWEYGFTFSDGKYCRCSACREIIKCIYPMRYCPACGAEMRGEANE